MEESIAIKMLALVGEFERVFNEAAHLTQQMKDKDEAKSIRRIWATMFEGGMDISGKVFEEYPSLRPKEDPTSPI